MLRLTLSLLMLGVLAYNHYVTFSLNDLALFADLLNGRFNLHFNTYPFLFGTPGDTALGEVIHRNLNSNLIAGEYPYIIHSQFA